MRNYISRRIIAYLDQSSIMLKGDKLMRLPSQDVPDSRDLVKSMSLDLEGPEDVVSADDYLRPQDMSHPLRQHNFEGPILSFGVCLFYNCLLMFKC